ncbi:MAG: RsmD family RNA methyltransferase [Methanomassiliicoccaceae archaeon]|nr:RsmD family RNA methyltransferase [Methanomassiliicoccaceae archaeon]
MTDTYFFELSGEHPSMPAAEALACVRAESPPDDVIGHVSGPGYALLRFDGNVFGNVTERIALTQKAGRHLGSFDIGETDRFRNITIPEGTFAVRARRFEGMMRDIDSQDLVRKLGGVLSRSNDVSLKEPDTEVRIFMSDKIHIFLCDADIDRSSFEKRKVAERPFFSPISIHPKFARASINLTCVKKGDTVLDPFCGTGGIIMEAASMGMRVIASDLDECMVTGCIENMEHYHLRLHDSDVLDIGDVPGRFGEVDAVVTDPPYGRSASTDGEDIVSLHRRAAVSVGRSLKKDGKAVMVLPYELGTDAAEYGMKKDNVFVQRVHRSLSRHYHVLSRT